MNLCSSSLFVFFTFFFQLCNAYTELNDPVVQRQRFAEQLKVMGYDIIVMVLLKLINFFSCIIRIVACFMCVLLHVRIGNRVMMKQWL